MIVVIFEEEKQTCCCCCMLTSCYISKTSNRPTDPPAQLAKNWWPIKSTALPGRQVGELDRPEWYHRTYVSVYVIIRLPSNVQCIGTHYLPPFVVVFMNFNFSFYISLVEGGRWQLTFGKFLCATFLQLQVKNTHTENATFNKTTMYSAYFRKR